MGKKRLPEESQKKHDKHMRTLKYLNTLREESIKKIDERPDVIFKKIDHKEKFKKLEIYFRSHTLYFNENSTVNDVIRYIIKDLSNIDFLESYSNSK